MKNAILLYWFVSLCLCVCIGEGSPVWAIVAVTVNFVVASLLVKYKVDGK